MAKVGLKSLCDIKKTYSSELSDYYFELFKSKLLGFMRRKKHNKRIQFFFQLTATHFV